MAQEHRRSPHEPERRGRSAPRTRSTQSRPAPARRRNGGASFALLYVIFVIGISALLACIGWVAANDVLALNKPEKTATITIREEDSFGDVVSMLEENGLIEYQSLFKLFAAFTGGRDKIVAGTFTLNTDMDYHALIAGMRSSSGNLSAETVTVTIPEGYTVRQTIALLAEKGVNTEEALTEAAQTGDFDYDFIDNESEDLSRLEGFLFPDTYEFYVGHNAEDALDRLIRNFVSRMDEERMTQVEESSYSLQEIITIALRSLSRV